MLPIVAHRLRSTSKIGACGGAAQIDHRLSESDLERSMGTLDHDGKN